jgi:hypothetical protein
MLMTLLTACYPTKNNLIRGDDINHYCNIYQKIPNEVLLKFKDSVFTLEDLTEIATNEKQYIKRKCNES